MLYLVCYPEYWLLSQRDGGGPAHTLPLKVDPMLHDLEHLYFTFILHLLPLGGLPPLPAFASKKQGRILLPTV